MRSYFLMVQWELASLRLMMPLMLAVQTLVGAGTVIGLSFLFETIPPEQGMYLATGGSILALVTVGLVMAPQLVAQHKMQKTYDYLLSLPVPRSVLALSGVTLWMMIALPGMALALVSASAWYGVALHVTPLLVPAVLLTMLMATSVGFALAHAIPHPSVTALVSQVLAFFLLLFSPINFPPERLPPWLQTVHAYLPIQHAAALLRGALTADGNPELLRSLIVLASWTAAAWVTMLFVLNRRR